MTATATKDALTKDTQAEFHELHVDTLAVVGDNVRQEIGDVTQLAESIKQHGVIQPIIATMRPIVDDAGEGDLGVRFTVVAGHRRLAAAKLAGLEKVPVILRSMDEQQRVEAMLLENLDREDLSAVEEGRGYRRLLDEFGLTQRQLAEKVSRSQGHVSKRLALIELPANIQAAVDSGGITLADALELTKLKDMPKRLTTAYARGVQWGNMARSVAEELDAHQLAERIGKAEQELKKDGVKIAKFKAAQWGGYELPRGVIKVGSWEWDQLRTKMKPIAHKTEPCAAFAVDPRTGDIVHVCTQPAGHKGQKVEVPADEKEQARKEREKERAAALRAREQNIALGLALDSKVRAPKIDADNMRLVADLLLMEIGTDLAHSSFKFTDDDSQTVIEKKDGTISRVAHVEGSESRALLDGRLADAKTAEEIMGVLLQALIATRYVNREAVPQSQRWADVRGIHRGAYEPAAKAARAAIEKLARKYGVIAVPKARTKKAA